MGRKSALRNTNGTNALHYIAGCHAAAAKDALGVVAHHMYGTGIQLVVVLLSLKSHAVIYAVFAAEFLQLTVAAAAANQTFLIVDGKDEF